MATRAPALNTYAVRKSGRSGAAIDEAAAPKPPDFHRLLVSLENPEFQTGKTAGHDPQGNLVQFFKSPDDELRLLWEKLAKLRLSQENLRSLLWAAIDFCQARYAQEVRAFVGKGGELPEHFAWKKTLRNARSEANNIPEADRQDWIHRQRDLLKEVEAGEADRRRWPDRKVNARMLQIADLARKLQSALAEVVSSPRLYGKAARTLSGPQLKEMSLGLQKLQALRQPGPTQTDQFLALRKEALKKMVAVMPVRKPHWLVLADLVYVASGKEFQISPTTLRREYADSISVTSAKKRGVSTMKSTQTPRDKM